jgi:ATP-binding cassette subfamily G (WHITE) protein 2 (PDR)
MRKSYHDRPISFRFSFGDLGKNCSNMVEYFSTHSNKQCEESDNPAEYMLDVIAEPPSGGVSDWHQVYLQSRLETTLQSDMAEIRSVHHGKPADHEDPKPATEFAASLGEQSRILVKRTALHFWRSPN